MLATPAGTQCRDQNTCAALGHRIPGLPAPAPTAKVEPCPVKRRKKSLKNTRSTKFSETRREPAASSAARPVRNYNNDSPGFI